MAASSEAAATCSTSAASASGPAAPQRRGGATQNSTDWNFMYGAGPSHSNMYYAEQKKGFKPGWDSMRRKDVIQPDTTRKYEEEYKANRQTATTQLRRDMLDAKRTYNPITGQERSPAGDWSTASNPWQHQKVGLKPVRAGQEAAAAQATRQQGQAQVVQLRQERMNTEGIKRPAGASVKDSLQWQ